MPKITIKNASRGRRPEWIAVVREAGDVREVYLGVDLIAALVRCDELYPNAKPEVRA